MSAKALCLLENCYCMTLAEPRKGALSFERINADVLLGKLVVITYGKRLLGIGAELPENAQPSESFPESAALTPRTRYYTVVGVASCPQSHPSSCFAKLA